MKKIEDFAKKYLENRPAFMAIIRSQEAVLFQNNFQYLKNPTLDFGCGDGFFAKLVFGKNKIDIGLDLKNSRIDESIKNKIYKKTVVYDGKKIPFRNNYFQTVVSNCVFEHIPNLSSSLKEIYRVLKTGGYLITTVMTDNWNKYLLGKKIVGQNYVNFMKKRQQHINLLSENRWVSKFRKNGFKVIKKIGYLNPQQAQQLDLWHYLSFFSLISYKVFKKWVIFPEVTKMLFLSKIRRVLSKKSNNKQSAALFFVLQKRVN